MNRRLPEDRERTKKIESRVFRAVVSIERHVDDHFPGFVECALTDASGEVHLFVEKVPVVSAQVLVASSRYPVEGVIDCEVEATWVDEAGRSLSRICTERPWNIESTSGQTVFVVPSSLLKACP